MAKCANSFRCASPHGSSVANCRWIPKAPTSRGRVHKILSRSVSRPQPNHQLVGAVLKYAQRTGKISRNVAAEIKRSEDLPMPVERERRYLNHAELLQLAKATERFETLTLVLGYCGLRFGEAAALRRKHVGDRELLVRSSATYVT